MRSLSSHLQELTQINPHPIPLLISVDQEGGRVPHLTKGFTIFPSNSAVGSTGVPEFARQNALTIGKELRAVGVNMNLAPVVDINSNPLNPIIGSRAFGSSVDQVVAFGEMALKGFYEAKILSTIKHFPGHGDVDVDSHKSLPLLNKTKKQLKSVELVPFTLLAPYTDAVMTAHIMVPEIDPHYCATFSKAILDILRCEIGFNGVVITDSLVMQGALNTVGSVDEAAICAIAAGCDILLLGGTQLIEGQKNLELTVADIQRIYTHLVEAVQNGRLPENRIDEAVERIMKLKTRLFSDESNNPHRN